MNKGLLTKESKKQIEQEALELSLVYLYLLNNYKENEEIESIELRDEFVLVDGQIRIPKITMIKNKNGITEILNKVKMENQPKEHLEKIAEIDENGIMTFSSEWNEKLRPFEEVRINKIFRWFSC